MANQESQARTRRVWLWLAVGATVVVAIVLLVVVASGVARQDDASPGTTNSAAPTSGDEPSSGPTPTPPVVSDPPAGEDPTPPAGGSTGPTPPPAQAPVALTEPAAPVPGVTFSIGKLEAVDGVANGPGEVAGPALRFAATVRNDTAEPVSLRSTVINMFAGAESTPMTEVGEPGGVPLPETVAAGESATGVFVFTVPDEFRDRIQISVDYLADAPVVLFEGEAPR
jgi:hypothetical protein